MEQKLEGVYMDNNGLIEQHQKNMKIKDWNQPNDSATYQQRLIDALGGVDNIVSSILSSKYRIFNDDEYQKMNDVIIQKKHDKNRTTVNKADHSILEQTVNNDIIDWSYTFSVRNTYTYKIFGDNIGATIMTFLYSKYAVLYFMISFFLKIIFYYVLVNTKIRMIGQAIIMFFDGIFWTFYILSSNRKCFRLLIGSFDFWAKNLSSLEFLIATQLYQYYTMPEKKDHLALSIIFDISTVYGFHTVLLFVASFEAIKMRFKIKIAFIVVFCIMTTLAAIQYTLAFHGMLTGSDYPDIVETFNVFGQTVHISYINIIAENETILAIFLLKQFVLTAKRKDKKCTSIKYSPGIKWIDDNMDMTANNLSQQIKSNDEPKTQKVKEIELNEIDTNKCNTIQQSAEDESTDESDNTSVP